MESIARWWTQASQEARFHYLRAVWHGQTKETIHEVRYAALLAEAEKGEID